jgi:hypothetical protein
MPAYNGYSDGTRLRSISGLAPLRQQTIQTEITCAKANNLTENIIWYTEVFSDRQLVNLLLLLIGKSTDSQTVFGAGNSQTYVSASNIGIKSTGTLNTKGIFWGNQDNVSCVKVFGMENWWGNQWRRIAGWISDKGNQKIKLTYGQSDGSAVNGYNTDGSGYISIGYILSGTIVGYITKMATTKYGLIPTVISGSATTYYTDGLFFRDSRLNYALVGGDTNNRLNAGAFDVSLDNSVSDAVWCIGASISCKPLAQTI